MGLYGSPDLSKKYGDKEEYEDRADNKPKLYGIFWFIIILDVLILWLVGLNKDNVLTALSLDSIVIFIYSLIMMIFNLYKRKNISSYGVMMGMAVIVFFASILTLGGDSLDIKNISNLDKNALEDKENLGSRKKPAKVGEIQQGNITDITGLDCLLEIELLEVKKKDEAMEMAKDIYAYAELGENQEYLFAKFRIKNLKNNTNKDLPFNFNWTNFSYATGDYKKYNYTMLAAGGDLLEAVDLYEGAEHVGWICLYVEKDDLQPKAVFLENLWFAL